MGRGAVGHLPGPLCSPCCRRPVGIPSDELGRVVSHLPGWQDERAKDLPVAEQPSVSGSGDPLPSFPPLEESCGDMGCLVYQFSRKRKL